MAVCPQGWENILREKGAFCGGENQIPRNTWEDYVEYIAAKWFFA